MWRRAPCFEGISSSSRKDATFWYANIFLSINLPYNCNSYRNWTGVFLCTEDGDVEQKRSQRPTKNILFCTELRTHLPCSHYNKIEVVLKISLLFNKAALSLSLLHAMSKRLKYFLCTTQQKNRLGNKLWRHEKHYLSIKKLYYDVTCKRPSCQSKRFTFLYHWIVGIMCMPDILNIIYNIITHVMYRQMVTRLFIHEGDYFLRQLKKRIIQKKRKHVKIHAQTRK